MKNLHKERKPSYRLNDNGEFSIENYNFSKPLANFFPGIAGKYGIPMWVFYVNRAQGVISFGTKDKDHSLLEFQPANKAWQFASTHGFRTFIKTAAAGKENFYEPFNNGWVNQDQEIVNKMSSTSYDLKLRETNLSLGLQVDIEYFTIPNDSYAGLARIVTIKNTAKRAKSIQLLDGLPQIIPYGTANLFLKKLPRTIEAWMNVEFLKEGVAFYKLDVDPTDRPEVLHIKEGNFYLGYSLDNKGQPRILKPIVDPQTVFGVNTDFTFPREFVTNPKFRRPAKEIANSKTPAGFLLDQATLPPQGTKIIFSILGCMRSRDHLSSCLSKLIAPGYLSQKKQENRELITRIQEDIATQSSSKVFDLYARQTYLDNVVRGGYPTVFKTSQEDDAQDNASVFYLYSRKHGDMERDYNKFLIEDTYFSQGNGNYRDTNQNRRSDAWFNPDIKDANILTFLNLIQTDGHNPLVVKSSSFLLKQKEECVKLLEDFCADKDSAGLCAFLSSPFTPGDLIFYLEDHNIPLKTSRDEFLCAVLSCSIKMQDAEHGEGFWIDHWHYNLDLIESYLALYPEKYTELILEKKVFTFFDNAECVLPRREKYVLKNGAVKQLRAVAADAQKLQMIKDRPHHPHIVRTKYGKGEIYHTTLLNKLLCLYVNKMSSFDPFGCGLEMDADKPNWYDALNGLPALMGSSSNETFELKRLIIFLKTALCQCSREKIPVTEEILRFLYSIDKTIQDYNRDNSAKKDFAYWDECSRLKEEYRALTKNGFSGEEKEITAGELTRILNNAAQKTEESIRRCKDPKQGFYYSYFINSVTDYLPLAAPFVKAEAFRQQKLPIYLESQMHALRLADNTAAAEKLYAAVKQTGLYDKELKMYKVTDSLLSMPHEIGRCRTFTPGWLENESIWLHMEYKYLLELLKKSLFKEFYSEFKNVLIPFQPPKRYGRSILENSSFIVSSAFPDKSLHGNGFVARLSGSTAEFLQIWLTMNIGLNPFYLNEKGQLCLRLAPILAGWLFDKKGLYSFNFLSKIRLTYHNPARKDTFGLRSVKPIRIVFTDEQEKKIELDSGVIPHPYAEQIRNRKIQCIDVFLG